MIGLALIAARLDRGVGRIGFMIGLLGLRGRLFL